MHIARDMTGWGIDSHNTIDRARIEARARRMGTAVRTAYDAFDRCARSGRGELERAWHELDDRVQDLAIITALLPAHHVVRLAAEHVRIAHARWTEDPDAERLPIALALALLDRALSETDRGLDRAA
ncbi:hypothetical protein [Sandaracinus amylolyticus]|nr:hypothetical protein [Sandaracinus amylolyticus]